MASCGMRVQKETRCTCATVPSYDASGVGLAGAGGVEPPPQPASTTPATDAVRAAAARRALTRRGRRTMPSTLGRTTYRAVAGLRCDTQVRGSRAPLT